jgi:hypothetical protein
VTKLELAQRLAQEAGLSGASNGTLPAAVTGQTGEMLTCINDLDAANQDIQNKKKNWKFLRFNFTFPTVAATAAYSPTDAGIAQLRDWITRDIRCYLTSTGIADEQEICYKPWDLFRRAYLIGSGTTTPGRPTHFTIKPDKSIQFYPVPDAIYTIAGEYYKKAQTMSVTDGPLFPSEFHLLAVWEALKKHARREGAAELYSIAKEAADPLWDAMFTDQLPPVTLAGPMV